MKDHKFESIKAAGSEDYKDGVRIDQNPWSGFDEAKARAWVRGWKSAELSFNRFVRRQVY